MKNISQKKYRILSLEAEKLAYGNSVGGFSMPEGAPDTSLFSGILDYSLESEKLYEVWQSSKCSRKMFFEKNGFHYTTAVIHVSFSYALHDYTRCGDKYLLFGHAPSDAYKDSSELLYNENGEPSLIAISTAHTVENPLSPALLGDYFTHDPQTGHYKRTDTPFLTLKKCKELREQLYEEGFVCGGVRYVRYKRSAGSSRTGSCLFIAEPLFRKMMKWSLCGLDIARDKELDLASFEAYISLSLSSIRDKLEIPTASILFMRDVKSRFFTDAAVVEPDGSGTLRPARRMTEVENKIWDGEALLDRSLFVENGYGKRGMMLLRNRFFKTCAFQTDLSTFFADHGITELSRLCGYTKATRLSDIKMIVTESSIKYLKLADSALSFEQKLERWLEHIEPIYGIVKTDKPTGYFGGNIVRTSYQLINTLGLTEEETHSLLSDTFEYYRNVRTSPLYMRNYINCTLSCADTEEPDLLDSYFYNIRQSAVMTMLAHNDGFAYTKMYEGFRRTVTRSFAAKIKSGQLLTPGTNATLFGNGLELLYAAIGKYHEGDEALALAGEGKLYCRHFADGQKLLGCRSPHVTMGNLLYAENTPCPEIDRYFVLSEEIVYVNAIRSNIQQRLNGCDYDSDTMLLTDQPIMVEAARRNCEQFPVPICSLLPKGKQYHNNPHDRAVLDHEISQNRIGEIINRSQLLNSLYWHNAAVYPDEKEKNEKLYLDICTLAVLSGMEIDKAKRTYDVTTKALLSALTSRYAMTSVPRFYAYRFGKAGAHEAFFHTTMDYLFSDTVDHVRRISHKRYEKRTLLSFFETAEKHSPTPEAFRSGINDARDCHALYEKLSALRRTIDVLRNNWQAKSEDDKMILCAKIMDIYGEGLALVSKKVRSYHAVKLLLRRIDRDFDSPDAGEINKKRAWFLLELLCLETKNALFQKLLTASRETDMYNLELHRDGDIFIYGLAHRKVLAKKKHIEKG